MGSMLLAVSLRINLLSVVAMKAVTLMVLLVSTAVMVELMSVLAMVVMMV